jgi:hypothetical protein
MDRYQTKRYVAVQWTDAVRLAQLDGTLPEEIRHTGSVELLHRTEWWAWWSDQQLTMAIGLPEELQPQGLSTDAVELITDVWCSESPAPSCGWSMLAQVQRVVLCEPLRVGIARGTFRPETWERLTVEFRDGQLGVLYRFWLGYEEGYLCQIWTEARDSSVGSWNQ